MGCCWLLRRCLARIRQVAGLLLRLTSQPCALEDSIRRRLVEAWVAAERSSITFSLKLQRGTGDNQADLIVSSRERALEPAKFHGARLRKEHYRNGGVARSRFVLCDDEDEGKLLAVFGLFGHFAEGAPFMQLAGSFSETSDLLDRCEDWTVVSTQPVLIEVPEEVRQEAARIARIKADELWGLQMLGDGNMRNFVLRSTSSITDPKELRMNLYIDSFAASTKDISVDSVWSCAICLGGAEAGASVRQLPCGHCFHGDCIKAWLRRGRQCPLGRCGVPQEARAAVRKLMEFRVPEEGAWPTLPPDVVKQDIGGPQRVGPPGRLPHLRSNSGWKRFRAKDFNAGILVQRLC